MSNKFLHIKIGVEFDKILSSHTAFQKNWKAISPSFHFLERISNLQDMNGGNPVEYYSPTIAEIYKSYLRTNDTVGYRTYLNALKDLELLEICESYRSSEKDNQGKEIQGYCKSYLVTEKCLDLLCQSHTQYLHKLHNDKKTMKQNKDNIRKRKKVIYSDYVLNYIQDGLDNFNYDYNKAMGMITGSGWNKETQESAEQSLINFDTKNFVPLKYNESDGRVFNDFVSMKSDLRTAFFYKKLKNIAVLDLRACHPTYFSTYILEYFYTSYINLPVNQKENEYNVNITYSLLTINNNSNISHSINYNNTINYNIQNSSTMLWTSSGLIITKEQMDGEHERWINLFCDESIDPREVIGAEIGKSKDEVKQQLNETLNGSKKYPLISQWINIHFPCLFKVWQSTDIKATGPCISRLCETQIMLNPEIYKLSESMELKMAYEYDGVSIFIDESTEKSIIISKLTQLVSAIKSLSKDKFGIIPVIKIKFI